MDAERLAEVDRALEALGAPSSEVRGETGLDLATVDRLLEELGRGVTPRTVTGAAARTLAEGSAPAAPSGSSSESEGALRDDAEAPAPAAAKRPEELEGEGPVTDASEAVDDEAQHTGDAGGVESELQAEAPGTQGDLGSGLDAEDLFGDLQESDPSGAAELTDLEQPGASTPGSSEAAAALDLDLAIDEGDDEEPTGLFSAEDIEAIRRSSAPPPGPSETAAAPVTGRSVPPPPPAEARVSSRPAEQIPAQEPLDDELDELLDDDFELMIDEEDDAGEGEPTFIGSVADFQAQLAADDAAAEAAAESPESDQAAASTEDEAPEGSGGGEDDEDGEKKGFFKKLFG